MTEALARVKAYEEQIEQMLLDNDQLEQDINGISKERDDLSDELGKLKS